MDDSDLSVIIEKLNSSLNVIEPYNHFYTWKHAKQPRKDGYDGFDLVLNTHRIDTMYCDDNKQTNMTI